MYPVSNGSTEDLMFVFILTMCVYVGTIFFLPFEGESLLCDICF